jgi:hypothetical protein
MRLSVRGPEGLIAVKAVETARPTVLSFEATSHKAAVMDVLCHRPDGLTWHLGSAVAQVGTHTYEVELNAFRLAGTHVLSVEVGGRLLPTRLEIEVTPVQAGHTRVRRARRYMGRAGS